MKYTIEIIDRVKIYDYFLNVSYINNMRFIYIILDL